MSAHPWWYITRATGIVAWFFLAVTMIDGASLAWRRSSSPGRTLDRHRLLGGFAVLFTAAHMIALLLDHFVDYGIAEVLFPFRSVYRPGPVAWGVVSLYLLLLVEGSSLVRRHLTTRRWRSLHLLSYPLFASATIHFLSAGTDAYRWIPFWLSMTFGGVILTGCAVGSARAQRRLDDTERLSA